MLTAIIYVSQFNVIKNEASTNNKTLFLSFQRVVISFKIDFLFFAIATMIIIKTKEHIILSARTSYAPISFSNLKYIGKNPQEK